MAELPMAEDRSITVVPATKGEIFMIGQIRVRILEDGSHTDNRLGAAEFIVPPQTSGPPAHWHEMHDETFLVTKGTLRFFNGSDAIDATAGDYVTVPIRAPHTFGNPFDEEAIFFNTFTPAFYINYFKLLADGSSPVQISQAMAKYATFEVL